MNNLIHYSPEVALAKQNGQPIVALESTIISHGMPYPDNQTTAVEVEGIIRQAGAVPATIALMDGKIQVGLMDNQLERLAKADNVIKASLRDMAYALSSQQLASTTVAATIICAQMAEIDFFVTGGIGGVHRDAEQTFDVSADLTELSNTPANVICAGAKSILDLPKTLEYLETMGVPIIGFQTDWFPAFFSQKSELEIPIRLDSVVAISQLIGMQRSLGLKQSVVIANPVPEEYAISYVEMKGLINQALVKANEQGIQGKAITPFLLQALNTMTSGKTLSTNIALIKNNAKLGAAIAVEANQ